MLRNPCYFNDLHANAALLRTVSPEVNPVDAKHLLQPNNQVEPHPFAFISESVIGMATSSDTDTMALGEAMAAPDKNEFTQAMHKELHDHVNRIHWKAVPTRSIPIHKRAIPMVWYTTHPDVTIRYKESGTVLCVHSDRSDLSESQACS